jgi:hypothetical protein
MPSIQLGLIAAVSEAAGFPTDTFYLNLDLAARLEPDRYELLCAHRGRMTSEWLFSVAAFPTEVVTDSHPYFDAFPDETELAEKDATLGAQQLACLREDVSRPHVKINC